MTTTELAIPAESRLKMSEAAKNRKKIHSVS